MKKKMLLFLLMGIGIFSLKLKAQVYSSCDRWAGMDFGTYEVWNNGWGEEYNYQCLWANSGSNWGVTNANHPYGGYGIKSYAHVNRTVNYNVDGMPSITSSFNVTRPGSGSYNTAYDIWYNNYAYEVMLWMNWNGVMGPIASNYNCGGACPEVTDVSIGGHTWNIYKGSNGYNAVFSFLRTSNTNSGTVDITAISQWLRNNGWFGNVNLHNIQFGWEITEASNISLTVNSYSVNIGSSCTPTAIIPYLQVNNGTWTQTSTATVASGTKIIFGPQPVTGGSWNWSGLGTSGTSREVTIYPTVSGTATATYTNACGTNSTQSFNITVSGTPPVTGIVSGGTYRITPRHSTGSAIDIANCGTANNTNVQQWAWLNNTCQQFIFTDVGSGYWRISPSNTLSTALDVNGNSTADGANVLIWTYGGGYNQQWQLVDLGSGYYQIKCRNSGKCLDVNGASTANGTNVQQWTCGGGYNQQFSLSRLKGGIVIEAMDASDYIAISPNPSSGSFKIDGITKGLLQISDINGKLLLSRKIEAEATVINSGLSAGLYIVTITEKDKINRLRLVIE